MVQVVAATKKNYALIGKIVCKTLPDIAMEIENKFQPASLPLANIKFYFDRYSALDLDMKQSELRRLFCAIMLKLYHPYVLTSGIIMIKYGFAERITESFDCKNQSVHRNIREAIIMYKAYEDFKAKVDELLEIITAGYSSGSLPG